MRAVLFLCVCVYFVAGQQNTNDLASLPKYDRRYDYLDLDALFISKRLVRNYVDCLINAQRCTPEGKQLKRVLPEALRTKCIRCTENQKRTAVKVIRRLKNEFPEEWAKFASRWDPTGDFTRYFEEYLANENFNTISGSAGNSGPSSAPVPTLPPLPVIPARIPNVAPTTARVPNVATTAAPPPPPPPAPLPTQPTPDSNTPPRPAILNRFGDDGELMMGSPTAAAFTPRPTRPSILPNTFKPTTRPTPITWAGAGSDAVPTLFPLQPSSDLPPAYTTAITFIDQIGIKIIRTTELVTDILKNTVRAVIGR